MRKEHGVILKKGFGGLSIALGYPDSYYIGMSNLGFQSLYKIFNADGRAVCERFFVEKKPVLPLCTIESKRKLSLFNMLAFSLSYELDAVNVLKALRWSGIKITWKERNRLDPLVIAGGAYASINPFPLMPFCDVFCLGDGEELAPAIIDILCRCKNKEEALEEFHQLDGFLVSKYYEIEGKPKKVLYVPDNAFQVLSSQIITGDTEFANTHLVEIMRGCPNRCRFCWIGSFQLPWKIHSSEKIINALPLPDKQHAIPHTKVGLIAPSSTDHPHFLEIVKQINNLGYKRIAFSSLKCDTFEDEYFKLIRDNNIKSITIAPETGSEELRQVINKPQTNDQIIFLCKKLAMNKVKYIKLYFMLDVPGETESDVKATVELIKKIKETVTPYGTRINASFNYLIPKPNTPFQYAAMSEEPVLNKKADFLHRELKQIKEVKHILMKPELAYYQALLALGDESFADFLEEILERNGEWKNLVREKLTCYRELLFHPDKKIREIPQQAIQSRFAEDYLYGEYEKALKKQTTPSCPGTDCTMCGICQV